MRSRILTGGAGSLLIAAGALMWAASWQRWAGACAWGQDEGGSCLARQDHRFDFIAPTTPWEPIGHAAELAGISLLVAALALALLPWALTGRRPGIVTGVVLTGAVLAQVSVGVATLVSGLSGEVVRPTVAALAMYLWLLWPPGLLVRFAFAAPGRWARTACIVLVLASPLVAAVSYAVGPYDAAPWWEATSGVLTVVGGLCFLVAAVRGGRPFAHEDVDDVSSPVLAEGPASRA